MDRLQLLWKFIENFAPNFLQSMRFHTFPIDYQNSLALSNSEQEDILKVSRNIPSRESYYDDQSYHSRGTRDSHAWSSYRWVFI